MSAALQLARLNARVTGLALRGRWLSVSDVADGYDRVADTYDEAWQCRLRRATDELLEKLPSGLPGVILDLGCGTGYASRKLAGWNHGAAVVGVDVSGAMLERARADAPPNLRCVVGDMLDFSRGQASGGVSMIVSTWALGYSRPARLFREWARMLGSGGTLAFIVNYADTLAPVFRAFRRCMLRHPDRVRMAALPRFPKDWRFLAEKLRRAGFGVTWHRDGCQPIEPPAGELLPWLRQTGILAGFDRMFDLSGPAAEDFERFLAPGRGDICHHFAMAIARRT